MSKNKIHTHVHHYDNFLIVVITALVVGACLGVINWTDKAKMANIGQNFAETAVVNQAVDQIASQSEE